MKTMKHFLPDSRPARREAGTSGFSLVEALVAVFIFSFMVLGTLPMFIISGRNISRTRNLLHLNDSSQAIMDELTARYQITQMSTVTPAPVDPVVGAPAATNIHVFNNSMSQSALTAAGANAPGAVVRLFAGSRADTGDRVSQNGNIALVQYRVEIAPEDTLAVKTRVKVTLEIFYFASVSAATQLNLTTWQTPGTVAMQHTVRAQFINYIDAPFNGPA